MNLDGRGEHQPPEPPTDKVTWPCGCVSWHHGGFLYLEVCPKGEGCPVVGIAAQEAAAGGEHIMWRETT